MEIDLVNILGELEELKYQVEEALKRETTKELELKTSELEYENTSLAGNIKTLHEEVSSEAAEELKLRNAELDDSIKKYQEHKTIDDEITIRQKQHAKNLERIKAKMSGFANTNNTYFSFDDNVYELWFDDDSRVLSGVLSFEPTNNARAFNFGNHWFTTEEAKEIRDILSSMIAYKENEANDYYKESLNND